MFGQFYFTEALSRGQKSFFVYKPKTCKYITYI